MKMLFRFVTVLAALVTVACAPRERVVVILSTNDMHAKIERFARLAAAVERCRDTVSDVVLADAGDRWTGNAFVDKAPTPGMPMLSLMNRLGFDVATLGNHEFDYGQAFLGRMLDSMRFAVVCANVVSDTATFPQMAPWTILERGGVRIGFVGVVTNYEGPGHPAGNDSSYAGLQFPDPQQAAARCARELRDKVDVLVLLSHMGDDRDREFLSSNSDYDLLLSGHTHVVVDTLVGGTPLLQTGKELRNVGVTVLRLKGHRLVGVETRVVPLSDYEPAPEYEALVADIYASPELTAPVGSLAEAADKQGLANWMAEAVADCADAEVGFYHVGGVRLDRVEKGAVSSATVYGLEPFGTHVAAMRMTPAQMRRMIVEKYNDTVNLKEAHRIDLIATTPYELVVDAEDRALDVRFPKLLEGRLYRVAMNDYIFRNYRALEYADGRILDDGVADVLLEELREDSPLHPDNEARQRVVRLGAGSH